jgi:hypothetical protein
MSAEDAVAELRRAERERRLLIEWMGGWLYFFYGPPHSNDVDADFAGIDAREFLTRLPRPKGRRRHEPRAASNVPPKHD